MIQLFLPRASKCEQRRLRNRVSGIWPPLQEDGHILLEPLDHVSLAGRRQFCTTTALARQVKDCRASRPGIPRKVFAELAEVE